MGFLKKIFRRKKSLASTSSDSNSNSNTSSSKRKLSRKEKKAIKNLEKSGSFLSEQPPPPPQDKRYGEDFGHGHGSDPTGNPRPSEDYVRKPSFSSQRSHRSGSDSAGTLSPNESRSPRSRRSPNSYDDGRDHDDGYNNMNIDRNSSRQQQHEREDRREHRREHGRDESRRDGGKQGGNHGMVQFGGENAFSSSPYQDQNDENMNYTNSRSTEKSYSSSPEKSQTPSPEKGQGRSSSSPSPRNQNQNQSDLQYDQLQRFDQQEKLQLQNSSRNNRRHHTHHPYENQQSQEKASRKMLQLTRLPNGQLAAMDRLNNSSPLSASSEFDLSTDAEDNEYNHIRQTASAKMKPMLQPHSPSSASEDDSRDNQREHESDDYGGDAVVMSTRSRHYFSDSDHESTLNSPSGGSFSNTSGSLKQKNSPTQDSAGSNEYSDRENGSNDRKEKSRFTFDNGFEDALVKSKRRSPKSSERPPSPTAFQKINKANKEDDKSQITEKSFESAMSPRALAIQAAQNMRAQGKRAPELYSDSTDSEFDGIDNRRDKKMQAVDLLPPRTSRSQESESKSHTSSKGGERDDGRRRTSRRRNEGRNEGVIENFADFETFSNNEFGRTSKSVAHTSPVSELLAQAQARRKNRKGGQSVNSEPALNAAMLRQQLKLPNAGSSSRPTSASSEAKKKLEKRKLEKEKFLKMLNDAKNGSDDDSDKEKDVNESWLFDEVTGALGPRGIAADLESLGERSNKSKTSLGNKSHRSHKSHRSNKSYKSHKSSASHRRSKRSDESVGSRHSRSSRYSVKSTKSYVSQMSQESRSVANDLIRLEMQLAMVGANLKNGDNEVKKQLELDAQRKGLKDGISVGESSIGMRSYSSRKSSRRNVTIPKRTKRSVKAPPGKLGIILANRTDSKGTVVSGVRTTSVLADKISPGDRIIAIDGEDVSRMSVPEITAIMARKNDFERVLTVLITPQK